jgi:hypothetical protein
MAFFFPINRLTATRVLKGEQLLRITLADDCCDFSFYESVEEQKPYREWCLPADVINRFGSVRLLSIEEEDELFPI